MMPANYLPISMTASEANAIRGDSDRCCDMYKLYNDIAFEIKNERLTVTEAQAVLVLTWNEVLTNLVAKNPEPKLEGSKPLRQSL